MEHTYQLWDHIYKTAELLSDLKLILENYHQSSLTSGTELLEALGEAASLEKYFENWVRTLPPDASYTPVGADRASQPEWILPLLEGSWRPQTVHIYPSLLSETKWRTYWTSRLVLNQAILQSIQLLESTGVPSGALPVNRRETEFTILSLIDRICETCLSSFTMPLQSKPKPETVEDYCSARGYVLLSPLPVASFCLQQAPISGLDLSGRIEWVQKALSLLESKVGFAKAGATLEPLQSNKISLQLWGLDDEDDSMEGMQEVVGHTN